MAFSAEQRPISKLLNDYILEIPRNQRHYVWKKDNWQDLLSDINFIVKNKDDKRHFIGSIVLKREESINGLDRYTIIDGNNEPSPLCYFYLQ